MNAPRDAERRRAGGAPTPFDTPRAVRIGNRYVVLESIGSGAFGKIYRGASLAGDGAPDVAVKVEPRGAAHPQLKFEASVYQSLVGVPGVPRMHYFTTVLEHNVMVLDLMGPSLEELFNYCGRRFTLKTVLMLADQMVQRVEYVHYKHYLHRDIKPDNFVVGTGEHARHVYLIDFGLAKRFRDPHTLFHNPYADGKALTGTARYASLNTHMGIAQSRRDDLESLGYVLVYFLRGRLPWQGQTAQTKEEKYAKILAKKRATTIEELCGDLPAEFQLYFKYVRSLQFDERPDYAYLRKILRNVFVRRGYSQDDMYDWVLRRMAEASASGAPGDAAAEFPSVPRALARESGDPAPGV